MSEDKESWQNKTSNDRKITEEELGDAIDAANAVLELCGELFPSAHNRDAISLTQQMRTLFPQTGSGGGMLAAIDLLTPESVGETEVRWFQGMARFGRDMINSVGRNAKASQDIEVVRFVGQLHMAVTTIETTFPEREHGAGRQF